MKCPWQTVTRESQDYIEKDNQGHPVIVTKTSFGDCIGTECPFWRADRRCGRVAHSGKEKIL